MPKSTIIIFTGLPGTGETTLSRQVAETLRIPLIAKDALKEIMYDKIGWSDKAFSAKLAHATFGIMEHITEQHLQTGRSIMLESNYSPKLANEKFQHWQHAYHCKIIQIVCQTEIAVLAARFFERQSRDRHPGHNDTGTVEEHVINLTGRMDNGEDQPLDVDGPVLLINTTDFSTVDAQEITEWIKDHMVR